MALETLFLSFAGPDSDWAEWVAFTLREADYDIDTDRDWRVGDNVVRRMSDALEVHRVICLFSPAYFEPERFTWDEWTSVMADPKRKGRLVPLVIEKVALPAILRPLIYAELFELSGDEARTKLLAAVSGPAPRTTRPAFPGKAP